MGNSRIKVLLADLTRIPEGIPSKDRRVYAVLYFGGYVGLSSHVALLIMFGLLHIPLMFYMNLFSILLWSMTLLFTTRSAFLLAGLFAMTELLLHQTLAVFALGLDAGYQYCLLILLVGPFLVLPARRMLISVIVAATALAFFLGFELLMPGMRPLYSLSSEKLFLLRVVALLCVASALPLQAYGFVHYMLKAEAKADREFERAETLLHNILPDSIAERLKASPTTIADGFDCASVLFCDIVDFTKFAERRNPSEVVAALNDLFSRFDSVAERHGLEKIKTIGDAYMVASGIPERCEDNAHSIADFALDIQEELAAFNAGLGLSLQLRVGINSGPVVAGVIGRKKFIYDLWGDAVNMASRMESHGLPGRIQVTAETHALLEDDYELEERGQIEVKGRGMVGVWLLNGRKPSTRAARDAPP